MIKGTTSRRMAASARVAAQRRRRNRLLFGGLGGFGLVALAVAIAVIAVQVSSGSTSPGDSAAASRMALTFSFTLFQGQDELGVETLDMDDLRGKPVVLNFWAGSCPPCRAEMPDLQRFYDHFNGEVTLVGVDIGQFTGLGSHRDARNLLQELSITYPAGFTNDGSTVRKYEVLGMPTTIFIDSDGYIFEKWSGALNREILERLTNAMLKQSQRPQS